MNGVADGVANGVANGVADDAITDVADEVVGEVATGVSIADICCMGVDMSVEKSGCTVFGSTVSGWVVSEARLR